MKKSILLLSMVAFLSSAKAQSNYLDTYIGATVTLTTIGSVANALNQPRDLDFKPNSNELWVANYGTSAGGSVVIFYDAGLSTQVSQYRKDTHSGHFMIYPNAFAFGDNGQWANISEIQSTNGGSSTFMGPALWSSDTSIFARVFQNNWVSGYPLGSHLDMLHQSPNAMGIAHDSAMAYWVLDGHNGNICKYDFVMHHGPGYDNHSSGKIWRYTDVSFSRTPQVPSHIVKDKSTGWLYFIDGGTKKIKRMNTNSGSVTGTLSVPGTSNEQLAGYWKVEGSTVETIATLSTQPCGIDFYNNRLIVSDFTTGDIYIYNTSGAVVLAGTIATGQPGMMGVKVGPDGHIWCVNSSTNSVYRLDVPLPANDAAIIQIASPIVESFEPSFYSTSFNVCDGSIIPQIIISNQGSNTINSINFEYTIDVGAPIPYSWSGTLASGATTSIILPSSSVVTGSHLLTARIITVNGIADDVDLNNIFTGSFRVINPPTTLPFNEGFTATTFPPSGWNYVNFNPNNKMTRVTAGGFGLSTGSLKMDNYSGDMNITGQKDYLMTPLIDFTSVSSNTWLRFNVAHAKYNTSSNDALQVVASTDCGNTWASIYNKSGNTLSTAPVSTGAFTPTATQWRTDSVNLTSYAGQPEVLFMFTSISNYGNNFYLDDVFISDLSTGIADIQNNLNVTISPNPVSDVLFVQIPENISLAELNIINILGETVYKENISNVNNLNIDVSKLHAGIYFVKLKVNNRIEAVKFVKQ